MHACTVHAMMQLIFKKYWDTAGDLLRSIFSLLLVDNFPMNLHSTQYFGRNEQMSVGQIPDLNLKVMFLFFNPLNFCLVI